MSDDITPTPDVALDLRAEYPALATLYDAWLGTGRRQPEAVRAFIELDRLRAENEMLRKSAAYERRAAQGREP